MNYPRRLDNILSYIIILSFYGSLQLFAQVNERVAKIQIEETAGLSRELQYIQVDIQIRGNKIQNLFAEDISSGTNIPCQLFTRLNHDDENISILTVIFPISLHAFEKKTVILRKSNHLDSLVTDLKVSGDKTELVIENTYFRADLRRSADSDAKSHYCGQLRELFLKMDFNQLFMRTENRMHWAPNFRKKGEEDYYTISDWENPHKNHIYRGPYSVITERQDFAPAIPEIFLSASYRFYANLPFFVFSSLMEVINDVWLDLLRNDEMTMDSLFTHVAYQTHNKTIIDLPFSTRENILKNEPIPADAHWLCFYNDETGYAFGSIRIVYNNRNEFGHRSPTYKPHTKISDGAGGGKYWNRRLIDDYPVLVPGGSKYYEQNAYLVFGIDSRQKFIHIDFWAKRLRNPPSVFVVQNYY